MTQKNFSFWFCTLLSGIVIGIASQRIPEAHANNEPSKPHSYAFYCNHPYPISTSGLETACRNLYKSDAICPNDH